MPTLLRQQAYPFGSLRKDPHWSVQGLMFYSQFKPARMLFDESRGNHGTITGATWVGGGLSFNGSDTDYVDCGTSLLATASDSITIIARLEAKALTTETTIVGIDKQQYILNIGSDGRLYSWWGTSFRKDSTDVWVSINTPITIAAVFNNPDNSVTYYVNGVAVEIIEETSTPGPSATDDNFRIGIDPRDAAGQNFDGIIEHISVYFRTLSASEIATLYLNPDLPMQQPPIWLFTPPVVGAVPKGPLGHPLYGPFAGPIAC